MNVITTSYQQQRLKTHVLQSKSTTSRRMRKFALIEIALIAIAVRETSTATGVAKAYWSFHCYVYSLLYPILNCSAISSLIRAASLRSRSPLRVVIPHSTDIARRSDRAMCPSIPFSLCARPSHIHGQGSQ